MTLSDKTATETLAHFSGSATITPPSATYVALFTADPGTADPAAGELDPAGFAYTRPEVSWNYDPNAGYVRILVNDAKISWATQSTGAAFDPVTHIALYDSATVGAGNMVAKGALQTAVTWETGKALVIREGQLVWEA